MSSPSESPVQITFDDEPDPNAVWRWVGAAIGPWLGWIVLGVGALLMLLGYLGVSRETLPAKQIPYLVSGGIGGMFLAVLGSYFLGMQALRRDSNRLDRLERMVEELHLALLRRPDAPDLTVLTESTAAQVNGRQHRAPLAGRVVVVEGGDLFHRPDCAMVRDKESTSLATAAARTRGLDPCPICAPVPVESATA